MLKQDWPRCAAICPADDGVVGAVWLAYERDRDAVHCYDACVFSHLALAVIAEGLNARGRFIPVAWPSKAELFKDELLNRGVNMMYDAADDSDAMAEIVSRTMLERMQTGRWRIDLRLAEWTAQFEVIKRLEGPINQAKGVPLMVASRYALQMLDRGRKPEAAVNRTGLYPKVAIV